MSDAPGPWVLLTCPTCGSTCQGPHGQTYCQLGHPAVEMQPVKARPA